MGASKAFKKGFIKYFVLFSNNCHLQREVGTAATDPLTLTRGRAQGQPRGHLAAVGRPRKAETEFQPRNPSHVKTSRRGLGRSLASQLTRMKKRPPTLRSTPSQARPSGTLKRPPTSLRLRSTEKDESLRLGQTRRRSIEAVVAQNPVKASVEAAANILTVVYPPRGQGIITAMARVTTAAEVKTTRGQIIEIAETLRGRVTFLDLSVWAFETLRVGSPVDIIVTSQDTEPEDVPLIHQVPAPWVPEDIGGCL